MRSGADGGGCDDGYGVERRGERGDAFSSRGREHAWDTARVRDDAREASLLQLLFGGALRCNFIS